MARPDNRTSRDLSTAFIERYPGEAVTVLETVSAREIAAFLERESPVRVAAVFRRLSPDLGSESLLLMRRDKRHRVLSTLDPALSAILLGRMNKSDREGCLEDLEEGVRSEIVDLMTYPPNTAGSIMETQIPDFRSDSTVQKALSRLRSLKAKGLQTIIVVDEERRLTGILPLTDLVLASPQEELRSLVTAEPVRVQAMSSREEVVELISQRGVSVLPVVDAENRLVGVIRHAALVKAVQEDALSDVQAMVGVSRDERALSPPFFAVRKRLPWLNINLLTAFLAAAVVGVFEGTISKFTALAVLLPVVAGQSGNTGAQALAVTMRGLALREIRLRHAARVLFKEAVAGTLNGLGVAAVTGLGVYVWSRSPGLSLVIIISMVISMVLAGLAGAAIPMVLTAARQDPAQSASIILTTVTDVVGFLSFLGLATLFSRFL